MNNIDLTESAKNRIIFIKNDKNNSQKFLRLTVKGGGWLLECQRIDEMGDPEYLYVQAWNNASAAKRDAKEHTNRKTFKWLQSGLDDKGKPTKFTATVDIR